MIHSLLTDLEGGTVEHAIFRHIVSMLRPKEIGRLELVNRSLQTDADEVARLIFVAIRAKNFRFATMPKSKKAKRPFYAKVLWKMAKPRAIIGQKREALKMVFEDDGSISWKSFPHPRSRMAGWQDG